LSEKGYRDDILPPSPLIHRYDS